MDPKINTMPFKTYTTSNTAYDEWSNDFKLSAPKSFQEAFAYINHPSFCASIYLSNDSGRPQWVASACIDGNDTGFWLFARPQRSQAIDMCRSLNWNFALS